MQPQPNKLSRSEQAKINGAKSRGPKTAEGHQKCAQSAQDAARRRAIPRPGALRTLRVALVTAG